MSSLQVGVERFHCTAEVSSFQGVGIEGFHCTTEVSSFGVGGEGGGGRGGGWNREVPLYTEVSPHFRGLE